MGLGPVEGFYLSIAFIIMLIGVARNYNRELGNTVVFISTVMLYAFVWQYGEGLLADAGNTFAPQSVNDLVAFVLTVILIAIVFASYAGRTFDFRGRPVPPPGGTLLSIAVGLLNGYLIAGTLWFIQGITLYPVQRIFPWFIPTNSAPAADLIATGTTWYWPPVLFPSPAFWAIPLAIMLILRVRG